MYKSVADLCIIKHNPMMKFDPSVFGQEATALTAMYHWQAGNPSIKIKCQTIIEEGRQGTVAEASSVVFMACAHTLPISKLIGGFACPKIIDGFASPKVISELLENAQCVEVGDNEEGRKLYAALKTSKHAARWLDRWMGSPEMLALLVYNTIHNIRCDVMDMEKEARRLSQVDKK